MCAAGNPMANARARQRKEDIGIGFPPRDNESTAPRQHFAGTRPNCTRQATMRRTVRLELRGTLRFPVRVLNHLTGSPVLIPLDPAMFWTDERRNRLQGERREAIELQQPDRFGVSSNTR